MTLSGTYNKETKRLTLSLSMMMFSSSLLDANVCEFKKNDIARPKIYSSSSQVKHQRIYNLSRVQ